MKQVTDELSRLNWGKTAYAVFVLCATTAIALPAQTFTTLHRFDNTDGGSPDAGLIQATNGSFYGTTYNGGANTGGTVFKITPTGALTTLYNFCSQSYCTDGGGVYAGLVQSANGDFYGTTVSGGANGYGTVFKITPGDKPTILYSFCSQGVYPACTDGASPYAGLVQAANGDIYGTTYSGGAHGGGTVFRIIPGGALTMPWYSFCSLSGCTDGSGPMAGLVQATNGNFYGTTSSGGAGASDGTVFKITPTGELTTLYSFCSQSGCTDGYGPEAGLVQATNGNFYGTTSDGGAHGYGTVFEITPGGKLTPLHSFCSQGVYPECMDGAFPYAALVQATDGDFYGTTLEGGANGYGAIFKITPVGKLTPLYPFCSQGGYPACTDGAVPYAALVQATNGSFYGTTEEGGAGYGTVFRLSVGLGPFVETQTTSGKVGAVVKILGTDLTSASSVSFNGTAAVFEVASSSLITATVPAGATTGTVEVVTPSGTLSSNVPFRVLP
jgi:uncharacterized repeat protein (TIGR03803 family)